MKCRMLTRNGEVMPHVLGDDEYQALKRDAEAWRKQNEPLTYTIEWVPLPLVHSEELTDDADA